MNLLYIESYPDIWEIPLNPWKGESGDVCSMFPACSQSFEEGKSESVYNLFKKNLDLFYNDKKQPFNVFGNGGFFDYPGREWRKEGMK